MWLQRFTQYLIRHRWQTLLLTFFITFIPIIGTLGIILATMITLTQGVRQGAFLVLAASLPYLSSFYFPAHASMAIPFVVCVVVAVAILSNFLTYVFAIMLRRKASWGLILQVAVLMGVLVVSIIHLLYPDIADWWEIQLQSYFSQAQTWVGKGNDITADFRTEAINMAKVYVSGLITAGVLFNAIIQLGLGRWWQYKVFNPGTLQKELHHIRLSHLAGVLFISSILLSYLGNRVVLDIMPILYLLFTVAGLSLIHAGFKKVSSKTAWFWLMFVYFMIFLVWPFSIIFISTLALLDIWMDFRTKFAKI